jgi:multidrug resistance efflux pump
MEMKPKKREWVKNAAIILLAVLLVLTFFSNTIMNRTLPEVSTQYVTDGKINAKVRGTGTVTANGNHQVKAGQTREIRSVMVKAGQKVETGDVLFILGSGESSEIDQAEEQLRQLQLSYQRTALSGTSYNYDADQRKVDAAQREYLDAVDRLEKLQDPKNESSESLKELRKQLEQATTERDGFQAAYDAKLNEASEALSAAESERLTAEQDVLLAEGWLGELSGEQQSRIDNPSIRLEELENDAEMDEGTKAGLIERWTVLKEKTDAVGASKAALGAVSSQQLDEAQRKVDEIQAAIDQKNDSPAYQEAKLAVETAEANYLDLYDALEQRKAADARASASLGVELADLNRQIEEQRAKLEELSGGEENQILANVSGTIQSIECTAGDTVPKDGVLCVIEVPDMGYTLSFSVTNQQASRLKLGDTGTISNYYWGSQITATLESIRVDPKNPQTNKVLTFDVTGDVNAGAELTISVGQSSANYDIIVPKSAIHSEATGSFVYKIEARNSPLGNRYVARRVTVEVLAEDDNNAAVSGDLGWGDYVIVTSNAPLKNGDLVRLAD